MNEQIGPSHAPRCRTRWPRCLAKHGLVHSVWRVPSLLTTQYLARYCGHRPFAWLDGADINVAAIPARTARDQACLREGFICNPPLSNGIAWASRRDVSTTDRGD